MTVASQAGVSIRDREPRSWIVREGGGLVALVLVFILLCSLLPLARLILAAVAPSGVLDLAPLRGLLAPEVRQAVVNTLVVGFGSTALALAVGVAMGILLATTDFAGRRVIAFVFVASLMIAPQVAALAFKTLAGPASPLLTQLGLAPPPGTPNPMLGAGGIIFAMGLHHAPLVAITLAPGFAAIPRSLIEAAAIDGAQPGTIVRRIVLPLLQPYLVAAALIAFVAGVGNFGIPALLGLPVGYATLPTLVFQQIASFGPALITNAAAISLLVAMVSGAGVVAAAFAIPLNGPRLEAEDRMPAFWKLGVWRWPVTTAVWLLIGLSIVLPLVSLIATSVVPTYGVQLSLDTFTVGRFYEVLVRQDVTLRAFRNSLFLAGTAALVLALAAIPIAYALDRRLARQRGPLMVLIEMPFAMPGIVLAIACILLFLRPLPIIGVSLYATPWIILFAYVARFLPLALKPTLAAMTGIARDQEEAAAVFGARLVDRLRYVVLPRLLAPAAAGSVMVFLLAFNELTVSALLWSAATETLGVALMSLEDAGLASEAAAIGVCATLLVVALMLLLDRLSSQLPADVLPWRLIAR
jgi:iron(III) transport system permease protein